MGASKTDQMGPEVSKQGAESGGKRTPLLATCHRVSINMLLNVFFLRRKQAAMIALAIKQTNKPEKGGEGAGRGEQNGCRAVCGLLSLGLLGIKIACQGRSAGREMCVCVWGGVSGTATQLSCFDAARCTRGGGGGRSRSL